ncbi:MAG: enoyl-CoA hydratase/isomerase family protein [Pikeienuella sp.]
MSEAVVLTIEGDVATILINKPEKRNALTVAGLLLFSEHLKAAEAADVRALIVTGAGDRAFSAGVDLSDVGQTENWGENPLMVLCNELEAFPRPTIAVLNGAVMGGAVELSLSCDFRIAAEGTKLMAPPARIGIHYEPAGIARAAACLGWQLTKRIFLLAEPFTADQLAETDYLDRIAPRDELSTVVDKMVDDIRLAAPLAINGMKQTIVEMSRGRLDMAVARERVTASWASEDMKEGLAAVQQKRRPNFTGK